MLVLVVDTCNLTDILRGLVSLIAFFSGYLHFTQTDTHNSHQLALYRQITVQHAYPLTRTYVCFEDRHQKDSKGALSVQQESVA